MIRLDRLENQQTKPTQAGPTGNTVTWVIRGYELDGDALVREVNVDDALRTVFRALLERPDSDPIVDSYALDAHALGLLAEMLGLDVDPAREAYFLDFDAS